MIREMEQLELNIHASYANNSAIYQYLGSTASLQEIVSFLEWDAAQPSFNIFLRQWIEKCPPYLLKPLMTHIEEEESQEHSKLFQFMLQHLRSQTSNNNKPSINYEVLDTLNYTFSQQCAEKKSFSFFLGSFWATEIMSAKRCSQLYEQLKKLGIQKDKMLYLDIHTNIDTSHGDQIKNEFILPHLQRNPNFLDEIVAGIDDRTTRSGTYLKWYEKNFYPLKK